MTEEEAVHHRIDTLERLVQQLRQTRQMLLQLSGGRDRTELLASNESAIERLTAGLADAQAKLARVSSSGVPRSARKKK